MKELLHKRYKNKISTLATEHIEVFDSVSKAKKKSRALQMAADGALGLGSLIVINK